MRSFRMHCARNEGVVIRGSEVVFGRGNQDVKPPGHSTGGAPGQPDSPTAQNTAAPAAPGTPTMSASSAPASGNAASVISEDVSIVGEKITLVTQSKVRVNGTIEGDINGREVVVGKSGRVNGTVTADNIQIEGRVNGALRGTSVTLMPEARVEGDIFHQKLAISEGAQFDGRVRRPQDPSEVQPNLDVDSLRGGSGGT